MLRSIDATARCSGSKPGPAARTRRTAPNVTPVATSSTTQIAVCVVLLVATGVTLGAVRRVLAAGPGFDPEHLAVASIDLSMRSYDRPRGERFYRQLLERLAALPGTRGVTLAKT